MQRAVRGTVIEIGPTFPWSYFASAPKDQRIPYLVGDEWIAIDGMHPSLPRVSTRLPSARAEVRAHVLGPEGVSAPHSLELVADMLMIDADQQRCSVVWRGHAELPEGEAGLARLRVFGAIALPGYPISWPSIEEVAAMGTPAIAIEETTGLPLGQTVTSVLDRGAGDVGALRSGVTAARRRVDADVLARRDGSAEAAGDAVSSGAARWTALRRERASRRAGPAILDDATSTLVGRRLRCRLRAVGDAVRRNPPSQPITLDSAELEDDDSHTQMISAQELERQAKARDAAPFPIAQPGERRPGPAIPLPGAPWSPPALGAPPPPPLRRLRPADRRAAGAHFRRLLRRAQRHRKRRATSGRIRTGCSTRSRPPTAGAVDELDRDWAEAIPPRTSEVARIVLDGPLKAALVAWQIRPPEDSLTIVVKGTFDLVPDERGALARGVGLSGRRSPRRRRRPEEPGLRVGPRGDEAPGRRDGDRDARTRRAGRRRRWRSRSASGRAAPDSSGRSTCSAIAPGRGASSRSRPATRRRFRRCRSSTSAPSAGRPSTRTRSASATRRRRATTAWRACRTSSCRVGS